MEGKAGLRIAYSNQKSVVFSFLLAKGNIAPINWLSDMTGRIFYYTTL